MPRVNKLDLACGAIDDAHHQREAHFVVRLIHKVAIKRGDGFAQILSRPGKVAFRKRFGERHEKRGGHAFASDVADHEQQLVLADLHCVVKIAAD